MQLVFVTAITKNYGYSKWIAWRQAITFHADSEFQWYSSEANFTKDISTKTNNTNISFKIAHQNIQFNLSGANELKINTLQIKKLPNKLVFIK